MEHLGNSGEYTLDTNFNTKSEAFKQFGEFLSTKIPDIDRSSRLGKAVRVLRYIDPIVTQSLKYRLSPSLVASLAMTESYGDPLSINENDGGAGLLHFQRPTVQLINNIYGTAFKTIASSEKYKKYFDERKDYIVDTQMAILFRDLVTKDDKIKSVGELGSDVYMKSSELQQLDDRFIPSKSIQMACMYLSYCKKHIDKTFVQKIKGSEWAKQKQLLGESKLKNYLLMNAFNKGPGNYGADFDLDNPSTHIGRVVQNAESLTRVLKIISHGIDGGESHELIFARIASEFQITSSLSGLSPKNNTSKEDTPSSSRRITGNNKPSQPKSSLIDLLQPGEFVMIGEDKQGHDIYKYKIMKGGQTGNQVKNILVEKFNTQFDMTFRINETYIVDATKQPLSDNQRLKEGTVIYITVPGVLKRMFD
ncbi:MAG TPA: hypothetical protein PLW93_04420 [Candidatus Absconditabacterales bacterium]|nr:hypothetical protein [Candidatus Absconditabacterales bacterium]HNG97487.1 hypothetical protein [Candidatus Absconditabacterales bacterium]